MEVFDMKVDVTEDYRNYRERLRVVFRISEVCLELLEAISG